MIPKKECHRRNHKKPAFDAGFFVFSERKKIIDKLFKLPALALIDQLVLMKIN